MANPSADFPAAVHSKTDVSAYTATPLGSSAVTHTQLEGKQEEEINAVQTKVGTGDSTPSAGKVLYSSGSGQSAWSDLNTLVDQNSLSDIVALATALG